MDNSVSTIVNHLQDEVNNNEEALEEYRPNQIEDNDRDPLTKQLREVQAISIRNRIIDLKRVISLLKTFNA